MGSKTTGSRLTMPTQQTGNVPNMMGDREKMQAMMQDMQPQASVAGGLTAYNPPAQNMQQTFGNFGAPQADLGQILQGLQQRSMGSAQGQSAILNRALNRRRY